MANTYKLISSTTLGSATASVTFSSIPTFYDDLALIVSARSNSTLYAYPTLITVAINDDTSSLYSFRAGYGQDGSSIANGSTAQIGIVVYSINSNNASSTANAFGSLELYFPQYRSVRNKIASGYAVTENNSVNFATIDYSSLLYRNTPAITSLVVREYTGSNFLTNSSFSLYGINNS